MGNRHKAFAEQLLSVRPTTRNLVTSVLMDVWPGHAAVVDFGIDSQKHYEALYYPIREAEIMPKTLDAALGDGSEADGADKSGGQQSAQRCGVPHVLGLGDRAGDSQRGTGRL